MNWGKCDVFQLYFMKNIFYEKYWPFKVRCVFLLHVALHRPRDNDSCCIFQQFNWPNHKPKQNFRFPIFQRSTCHSIFVHFHSFYGSYFSLLTFKFCRQNFVDQILRLTSNQRKNLGHLCLLLEVLQCSPPFSRTNTFIFALLFQPTKHSPSLQKASRSNPHPLFSNCMWNDVMSMRHCLTSFRKKQLYTT